eukprot:scaffold331_cov117-Cylindrotheca_fusiformis.AAC.1
MTACSELGTCLPGRSQIGPACSIGQYKCHLRRFDEPSPMLETWNTERGVGRRWRLMETIRKRFISVWKAIETGRTTNYCEAGQGAIYSGHGYSCRFPWLASAGFAMSHSTVWIDQLVFCTTVPPGNRVAETSNA